MPVYVVGGMSIKQRFQAMFNCAVVIPVDHNGDTYYVTDGTGEGVFAYEEKDFKAGVEAAEAASRDRYLEFCRNTDPVDDPDVARGIYRETGLSICHDGLCMPVINFVDIDDALSDEEFEEGGSAYIRQGGDLYVKTSASSREKYLGTVLDENIARAYIKDFFESLEQE